MARLACTRYTKCQIFSAAKPAALPPCAAARLPGVYLRSSDLPDLMELARAAVVGQASNILRDDPAADVQYIVLDLPCSFFSLRSLRWERLCCGEHVA